MTNEQALGRAVALLQSVSSLDASGDVCDGWGGDYYTTGKFDELVKEIDRFLDDELRREG